MQRRSSGSRGRGGGNSVKRVLVGQTIWLMLVRKVVLVVGKVVLVVWMDLWGRGPGIVGL